MKFYTMCPDLVTTPTILTTLILANNIAARCLEVSAVFQERLKLLYMCTRKFSFGVQMPSLQLQAQGLSQGFRAINTFIRDMG